MLFVSLLLALVYAVVFLVFLKFFKGFIFIPILIVGISLFVQYFFSHKIVMYTMRAKKVTRNEEPELYEIVERLCASAALPMPTVTVSDMPMMNAFATGRNSKHAVVSVTQQLKDRLAYEELEAVLAHELNHIRHYDAFIITFATFLSLVIMMIVRFISNIFIFMGFGGNRDSEKDGILRLLAVVLVGIISYVISFMLIRALSRYRELAADRAAAYLTGKPSALASALLKISSASQQIPQEDLRSTEQLSALMIFNKHSFFNLFSTHPSLDKRIKQLNDIQNRMITRG
jgi:heat shock protein HtpX